jgi:hypothetical protein
MLPQPTDAHKQATSQVSAKYVKEKLILSRKPLTEGKTDGQTSLYHNTSHLKTDR